MNDNISNSQNNNEDYPIDSIALLRKVWIGRKLICWATILFIIIGCIVALLSPVVYTSQTIFVPQVGEDEMTPSQSGLGSLANLAGIKLNESSVSSDSYLSPLLYSKIAESEEFSLNVIKEEITNLNGDKIIIKEYLLSNQSSVNSKKNTEYETQVKKSDILKNYSFINEEDYYLILKFKSKFSIVINDKEGYIQILASDKDAFISTQIVEKVTKNLQSKIIELRTEKIKERLEYSKEQYQLKQAEFDLLQKTLAEFKDSNKNISTATFMSQLQKLDSEYQLQESILINLASEFNNNKIKLNKDTPIFSVIDEVSIPYIRSAPVRSKIALIYGFVGLAISIGFIITKDSITDLIKKIKN